MAFEDFKERCRQDKINFLDLFKRVDVDVDSRGEHCLYKITFPSARVCELIDFTTSDGNKLGAYTGFKIMQYSPLFNKYKTAYLYPLGESSRFNFYLRGKHSQLFCVYDKATNAISDPLLFEDAMDAVFELIKWS